MVTTYLLLPLAAPSAAAAAIALLGWRRATAGLTAVASAVILGCGIALAGTLDGHPHLAVGHLLRADQLTATMLIVIGAVGTLSCLASVGYIEAELVHGHTTPRGARHYGILLGTFLTAMSLAVVANNLGIVWVAIEATTVATAFLVGHRGTRGALEATWKYVIICSVGIAFAFLGTVLLYFAGQHAGGGSSALDLDVLMQHAARLDSAVTHLAAGLLLIGYGTKVGLVPFHTWLADAHSQAPAPVSALMSGVLLAVAFSALLRVKSVIDVALGTGFLRAGLLVSGLLTLLVAAALLVGQRDYKRMLAYSSMENMGLIAVAAAGGTELAIAALLLHVIAHGLGKTVLFLSAGQLQVAHGSTAIDDVGGLLGRPRLVGVAFAVGIVVLLGLPPFAMFASELSIARGLAANHLAWALGVALLFVLVSFAALAVGAGRMLLGPAASLGPHDPAGPPGPPGPAAPAISTPATVAVALTLGIVACAAIGVTAGPLTSLLHHAAAALGAPT